MGRRLQVATRTLRAEAAYVRILLVEFRWTLLLVAAILSVGSLLFHFLQRRATGEELDYAESLYRTFMLMAGSFPDDLPRHLALRLWCFAVPFLSFLVVSEGVVRLAVLLSSRTAAGPRWVKAMVATYDKHVIVCGLGRLGFSIVEELHRQGTPVVAIDRSAEAFGAGLARKLDVPVVIEDARHEQVLRDLAIDRAQAVVAVTDDDMANLEIALDARTLRPDVRVVVRMFDKRIAEKIARNFDIKLIFSPSALAAPSFAAATADRTLVNSFYIDDKQLQTVKLPIAPGSPLVGKRVGFLREGRELSILSHRRKNREADLFPSDEVVLQAEDRVAVLAQSHVIGQLHALNRPPDAA
jgi:voltage-gated potassium channel